MSENLMWYVSIIGLAFGAALIVYGAWLHSDWILSITLGFLTAIFYTACVWEWIIWDEKVKKLKKENDELKENIKKLGFLMDERIIKAAFGVEDKK